MTVHYNQHNVGAVKDIFNADLLQAMKWTIHAWNAISQETIKIVGMPYFIVQLTITKALILHFVLPHRLIDTMLLHSGPPYLCITTK